MKTSVCISLFLAYLYALPTSEGAIMTPWSSCRGSKLMESDQDKTGTLTYSSNRRFLCRWNIQPLEDLGEALILHVKSINIPQCEAHLHLPGTDRICTHEAPYCHAYISNHSYCDETDIKQQAAEAYSECTTTKIHSGLTTMKVDYTPSERTRVSFTIEFRKIECKATSSGNQSELMTSAANVRNEPTTNNPVVSTVLEARESTTVPAGVVENRALGEAAKPLETTPAMVAESSRADSETTSYAGVQTAATMAEKTSGVTFTGSETTSNDWTTGGSVHGNRDSAASKGMIAGIIIASVALIASAVTIIFLMQRRNRKDRAESGTPQSSTAQHKALIKDAEGPKRQASCDQVEPRIAQSDTPKTDESSLARGQEMIQLAEDSGSPPSQQEVCFINSSTRKTYEEA